MEGFKGRPREELSIQKFGGYKTEVKEIIGRKGKASAKK